MSVTFELPSDIEQSLRREFLDLNQTAKEAALIELYRRQKLSAAQLARALDVTRIELEGILYRHDVVDDLPSETEHQAALERLRAATGQ